MGVFTSVYVEKDEPVLTFINNKVVPYQNYYTLQLGEGEHLLSLCDEGAGSEQHKNHEVGDQGIFEEGEIGIFSNQNDNDNDNTNQNQNHIVLDKGEDDLGPIENFVNHSCCPNSYVEFLYFDDPDLGETVPHWTVRLVAIQPLSEGTEITFDYNCTEWDLESWDFHCECGTPSCVGAVKGFRHLPLEEKEKRKPFLPSHILARFHETESDGFCPRR